MPDVCIALCTCPDQAVAEDLARALVNRKLAACVNIIPAVQSVYRWQDEVVIDQECQLIIKTTHALQEAARQCVEAQHPYELPEWLIIADIEGSDAYLNWIRSNLNEV